MSHNNVEKLRIDIMLKSYDRLIAVFMSFWRLCSIPETDIQIFMVIRNGY
jgi:hypothetical protein